MTAKPVVQDNAALQTLLERHSVRSYRQGHKLPEEDIRTILQAAGAAPSAWNLQHWKFLVVVEQEDKEKLLPIAYNQKQIVESSVTFAILGDTEANRNAEPIYSQAVQEGKVPADFKDRIVDSINQAYENGGERFGRDHAFLNASLAAMQLMIAAEALGYSSVPMSGFDSAKLSEVFKIPSRYVPVMLISVGVGEQPGRPSARLPLDSIVFRPGQE